MKIHGWRTDEMDRRYGVVDTADADAVRILMDSRRQTTEKPLQWHQKGLPGGGLNFISKCFINSLVRMRGLEPPRPFEH